MVVGVHHALYLFIFRKYVTGFVDQVMQELGLIGLRIQRMPSEPGLEFGIPSQYSYMTVSIFLNRISMRT